MPHHGTSTIDVDATAEELFEIVTDLEAFPEWLSDVKRVEILEADNISTMQQKAVDEQSRR